MTLTRLIAASAFLVAVAGAASAQETGGYPPGSTPAEIDAYERAETARLNQAVLDRDAQIVAANEAEAARFAADQARYESEMARHAADQARYEADAAAAEAARQRYEAEMAAWRRASGNRDY